MGPVDKLGHEALGWVESRSLWASLVLLRGWIHIVLAGLRAPELRVLLITHGADMCKFARVIMAVGGWRVESIACLPVSDDTFG